MRLDERFTDRIRFVPVTKDQTAEIHAYASDPEVKQYIGWRLKEKEEDTEALIDLMLERNEAKTHYYASVEELETGKIIGSVMIFGMDLEARHGEIGYVFHKDFWGKGFATEAVGLMVDFMERELGFRKAYGKIVGANGASGKVLEKCGFHLEATLMDHFFVNGKLEDCCIYSRYINI